MNFTSGCVFRFQIPFPQVIINDIISVHIKARIAVTFRGERLFGEKSQKSQHYLLISVPSNSF